MEKISKKNFEEKTREGTCLIKFGAEWCGPCKTLDNVLGSLEKKTEGVKFYEVDVEKDQELANEYGIRCVPFILKTEEGENAGSLIGVQSESTLQKFILEDSLEGENK